MATRRRFIRDCSALAASAALVPSSLMAAPRRWREVSLANVTFGTFAAQLRSCFLSRAADGDVQPLVLVEAMPGGGQGGEAFSLLFRGAAARPLRQDTYWFEHDRIGRFEMFIVPIGCRDRSCCYYEAVFNRPPPEWRPRTVRGAAAIPATRKDSHG